MTDRLWETLENEFNTTNKDYIEITKDDEKLYKTIKGLFTGVDNWDYLYNEMSTHHDYLEFYYLIIPKIHHQHINKNLKALE